MKKLVAILLLVAIPGAGIAGAETPSLEAADRAYRDGDSEMGHRILRSVMDANPGDYDLAVDCLEKILWKLDRLDATDPWLRYVTTRFLALERLGVISPNTRTMRIVLDIELKLGMAGHRFLEVAEKVEELARESPHDLHWKILRAKTARELDLPETRDLYQELREEADPDHPDQVTRERWNMMAEELDADPKSLPAGVDPIPGGSPMILMEPDDPDGRWRQVLERAPSDIPDQIDRLMNLSLIAETIVPWRDLSGLTDPSRALDLHLLSKPPDQLAKLRNVQSESFTLERIPKHPSEAEILALSRRFPWAEGAHEMLLNLGNRMLWDGRAHSALRSFRELLRHSANPDLLAKTQVGYWTALAQIGDADAVRKETAKADPTQQFPWMGKTATATEIRDRLLDGKTAPPAETAPKAQSLSSSVIRIPPVSPWPSNAHSPSTALDFQFSGDDFLISGRNLLAMFQTKPFTGSPKWVLSQRFPAEGNNRDNLRPGYFLPVIDPSRVYSRWGFRSAPDGIAAFERGSGRPLWTSEGTYGRSPQNRPNGFDVPIGDPAKADGRLFYLQWSTVHDLNHNRGRRLNLVCFDPEKSRPAWVYTIAESGFSSDIKAALERASSDWAIYGNRVTVHRGAVYSCSNAGSVARSDVRDGHTDWVYFYRKGKHGNRAGHLGADPMIVGDLVICMPRDAERVIALDQRTGRLVWENPLVVPEQLVGVHGDLLLIRGKGNLIGLAIENGEARWVTPIHGEVIGRAQQIGSSVFAATRESLRQVDAPTGEVIGKKKWDLGEGRPLSYAIGNGGLYVVTDQPADDPGQKLGGPLNKAAPDTTAPLSTSIEQVWTLHRNNAAVAVPPPGAPLDGRAFVLSAGILECVDLSAKGAIRWRRFVHTINPGITFSGENLLLFSRGAGGGRRVGPDGLVLEPTGDLITAYRGADGKVLWESPMPAGLDHMLDFGATQVFHDARARIWALDPSTGERRWERHFGRGHLMRAAKADGKLQVFFTSFERAARHFTFEPESGAPISDHEVVIQRSDFTPSNGRAIDDGYFEVTFAPLKTRYFRLTTLSEINGRGWASAAELHVVGEDGKNVSRKDWSIEVDSYEPNSKRYTTTPENLFDNDRDSWWHSQWLDGIPPHPHTVAIDLGEEQVIKGLRYLPAVIINNNGMIKDYELHVSENGEDWGEPVAKGVMVNRLRVNKAMFADGGLFFEYHDPTTRRNQVCRYRLDGKAAQPAIENGRIESVSGKYAIVNSENNLIVLKADDPSYLYRVGNFGDDLQGVRFQNVWIENDKLVMPFARIAVADLAKKQLLVKPVKEEHGLPRNRNGVVVRGDGGKIIKLVHLGNEGQSLTLIDPKSGALHDAVLPNQVDPFQAFRRPRYQNHSPIVSFDRVLLFSDNRSISAWITAPAAEGPE